MFDSLHTATTLEVIALGAYTIVIAFYSYLGLAAISLLGWRFICSYLPSRHNIRHKRPRKNGSHKKANFLKRARALLKRSLLLNFVLAVGSTVACFAILAELPLRTNMIFKVATVIACVVPFIWGFSRTASIGNHAGAIGVFAGLVWLATYSPEVHWIDNAPLFLLINIAGNVSGWLGAVAGQGQKRDSVGVSIIELLETPDQATIVQLSNSVQNGVQASINALKAALRFRRWPEKMVLAYRDGSQDMLDFTESMEWRKRSFPQIQLWTWFSKAQKHSVNEIVDNATSLLKFTVIRAQLNLSYDNESGLRRAQAFITTFNETSTIVWVDRVTKRMARRIHKTVLSDLRSNGLEPMDETWAILHKRQGRPTIEQWAKRTLAAERREHVLQRNKPSSQSASLLMRFEQAFKTETWFDRFRGKRTTFVVALGLEILLALGINWLSVKLF
jgi:hypothetical protein